MKTISTKVLANGKTRMTVELDEHETLLPVRTNTHYKLGGQMDDVIPSHVLEETAEVTWCHFDQKWITA